MIWELLPYSDMWLRANYYACHKVFRKLLVGNFYSARNSLGYFFQSSNSKLEICENNGIALDFLKLGPSWFALNLLGIVVEEQNSYVI